MAGPCLTRGAATIKGTTIKGAVFLCVIVGGLLEAVVAGDSGFECFCCPPLEEACVAPDSRRGGCLDVGFDRCRG